MKYKIIRTIIFTTSVSVHVLSLGTKSISLRAQELFTHSCHLHLTCTVIFHQLRLRAFCFCLKFCTVDSYLFLGSVCLKRERKCFPIFQNELISFVMSRRLLCVTIHLVEKNKTLYVQLLSYVYQAI